jgi:PAS domain S-box-containing protein/putative nucleotidyltransferase with HDIG domain
MRTSHPTILIVDDEPAGRDTLEAILYRQGYELAFATNGAEALELAINLLPDVVLLDVMMPGMDGFEVCRRLRAEARVAEVPVILVTALDDRESHILGFEAGADDFISKPFDRFVLRARVRSVTRLNRYRHLHHERAKFERVVSLAPNGLLILDEAGTIHFANPAWRGLIDAHHAPSVGQTIEPYIVDWQSFRHHLTTVHQQGEGRWESILRRANGTTLPVECVAGTLDWEGQPVVQVIVRDISQQKQAQAAIERSNMELAHAYDATLEGWVAFLDLRDKETEGHTQRVTEMTLRLAHAMGIPSEQLVHVRRGALLHDIGKMGIPDRILHKPGPLNEEEWATMRQHPVYAHALLEPIAFLRPALDIPYYHHEKWDGTGYPRGLRGEEIPLLARLFAVVDVWDALSSDRPYRPAWSPAKVRKHIAQQAGTHFDPRVVAAFLTLLGDKG